MTGGRWGEEEDKRDREREDGRGVETRRGEAGCEGKKRREREREGERKQVGR